MFLAPVRLDGLTALKTQREALASPPVWIFEPQWHNFVGAWNSNDFGTLVPDHHVGLGLLGRS